MIGNDALATALWLAVICFMLHELEEIALSRPFVRRTLAGDDATTPTGRRARRNTFAVRYRSIGGEVAALVIIEETLVVAALLGAAGVLGRAELAAGVIAVLALHHVGHFGMSIAARRYTPGLVTAIATAPVLGWCVVAVLGSTATSPFGVVVATLVAAAVLGGNLALVPRLEPALHRALERYADAGRSP